MTLKDAGYSKPHKKGSKHRPIKCSNCKSLIDIEYALSVGDFEYTDNSNSKSKIWVYCPSCGLEHEYKL